jgi:hypothetical protein
MGRVTRVAVLLPVVPDVVMFRGIYDTERDDVACLCVECSIRLALLPNKCVPPRFSVSFGAALNKIFPDCWIGKGGPI